MAYDPTTKIITAPVGTPDLQKCFAVRVQANVTIDGRTETINVLSGDIGVNCALETGDTFIADYIYRDALGTHAIPNVTWTVVSRNEINKWAKYKPVRWNSINTLLQWNFAANRWKTQSELGAGVRPWWMSSVNNAVGGIQTLYSSNLNTVLGAYDGDMNGWQYLKPNGGLLQPYRITDFAGYSHLAPEPISNFIIDSRISQTGQFSAGAMMPAPSESEENNYLSLADFGEFYFGVVFVKNGILKLIVTTDETVSSGASPTIVQQFSAGTYLQLGTYDVYPVFTNQAIQMTTNPNLNNVVFTSCPCLSHSTTEIATDAYDVAIDARWTGVISDPKRVEYSIQAIGSAITNVMCYIIPTTYYDNPSSGISAAVASETIGNISGDQTRTGMFNLSGLISDHNYFMYVTFGEASQYNRKMLIRDVAPSQ